MKTGELHDRFIEVLFALADKGVVKIFGRGIDINDEKLYEVLDQKGISLAEGTEEDVLERLGEDYAATNS